MTDAFGMKHDLCINERSEFRKMAEHTFHAAINSNAYFKHERNVTASKFHYEREVKQYDEWSWWLSKKLKEDIQSLCECFTGIDRDK